MKWPKFYLFEMFWYPKWCMRVHRLVPKKLPWLCVLFYKDDIYLEIQVPPPPSEKSLLFMNPIYFVMNIGWCTFMFSVKAYLFSFDFVLLLGICILLNLLYFYLYHSLFSYIAIVLDGQKKLKYETEILYVMGNAKLCCNEYYV